MDDVVRELSNEGIVDVRFLARKSTLEVLQQMSLFASKSDDERRAIKATVERYACEAGGLKDAGDKIIRKIALGIEREKMWEMDGLTKQEYLEVFPRIKSALGNIDVNSTKRKRLASQIVKEWGAAGLGLITKEASLEALLAKIETEEDDTWAKNVLQNLSNAAKRVDFETAAIVFQLANVRVTSGEVFIEEASTKNADGLLTRMLREAHEEGGANTVWIVGTGSLSVAQRAVNSTAIKDEALEQLRRVTAGVSDYTFNDITWDFENPVNKTAVEMAAMKMGRSQRGSSSSPSKRKRKAPDFSGHRPARQAIAPPAVSTTSLPSVVTLPPAPSSMPVDTTSSAPPAASAMHPPPAPALLPPARAQASEPVNTVAEEGDTEMEDVHGLSDKGKAKATYSAEELDWAEKASGLNYVAREAMALRHLEQAFLLWKGNTEGMNESVKQMFDVIQGEMAEVIEFEPSLQVGLFDAAEDIQRMLDAEGEL